MNIPQLAIAGSAVTTFTQSRASEVDRVSQDASAAQREQDSVDVAEAAEGVGVTNEEQGASDRDADGRRPWEMPHRATKASTEDTDRSEAVAGAKDPTGNAGSQLDLHG
jgi:hypothetical protein